MVDLYQNSFGNLAVEFAQLDKDFCNWETSRTGSKCDEESINRSAFVSWVDCRL